jgi:hypothetical protein
MSNTRGLEPEDKRSNFLVKGQLRSLGIKRPNAGVMSGQKPE